MFKYFLYNILFLLVLGSVAYASEEITSIDYGKEKPKNLMLDNAPAKEVKSFTLRSGMQFRGEKVINDKPNYNYISLNTSITYQKGQNSYVLPYRKTVLNRITFNPNTSLRNYYR